MGASAWLLLVVATVLADSGPKDPPAAKAFHIKLAMAPRQRRDVALAGRRSSCDGNVETPCDGAPESPTISGNQWANVTVRYETAWFGGATVPLWGLMLAAIRPRWRRELFGAFLSG